MGSLMADLLPRLHAADTDNHTDFFDRERANLLAYLGYLRANPAHVRLAGEIKVHEPELYRRAIGDWMRRIAARIRGGIARGTVRPMDDAEITAQAYFLLGAGQILDQVLEGGRALAYPGDEALVDAYVALLRNGLARDSGSRGRLTGRSGAAVGSRSPKTSGRPGRWISPSRSGRRKGR
jgi:AcrR family transcriptional regulator